MLYEEMEALLKEKGVELKPKKDSFWMRLVGKIVPRFMNYWTTVGKTIYYPSHLIRNPLKIVCHQTLLHELVHVKQYEKYGAVGFLFLYCLIPLPVLFAYFRWKLEREAYLLDIKAGMTVEHAVNELAAYLYPWPKCWMRKWFNEELAKA
jgi:hypothetical protein